MSVCAAEERLHLAYKASRQDFNAHKQHQITALSDEKSLMTIGKMMIQQSEEMKESLDHDNVRARRPLKPS